MATVDEVMDDIARYLRELEQGGERGHPGIQRDALIVAGTVSASGWAVHKETNERKYEDAIRRGIAAKLFEEETHFECTNIVLTERGRKFADDLLEEDKMGKMGFKP